MRRKAIKYLAIAALLSMLVVIAAIALSQEKRAEKKSELYQQINIFTDGFSIIKEDYVEEVDSQKLFYGALQGMLAVLDAHSQFLDPDTYKELMADTTGEFGGLGIEITIKDGLLTVVTPIEGTPAWKQGLKAGDRIVRINEELTRDITLLEAVRKLRGEPKTAVNLTILREKQDKLLEFTIVREIIKIKDIKDTVILEDGIGYIRLAEFRQNTPQDFRREMERLKSEGMDALILDLRNNPGGLLDIAVKITENFLGRGSRIVSTRSRKKNQDLEFTSANRRADTETPMVVLINRGSASGSEILAAALQDHKRAIILGNKSFGKGSVQTVIPLSDGSAIRLTTSKYFSPNGNVIHGEGVTPDIIVEEAEVQLLNEESAERPVDIFKELEPIPLRQIPEKYLSDNQLMHALDVLKAIKIYRRR